MTAASNYFENLIIDHLLRAVAHTPPATIYLALYSSDPTDADVGTEAAGGSYARQAITLSAASGGTTSNTNSIDFDNMPAGTWTHVGVRSALTAGNLYVHAELSAPITTEAGDKIEWDPGDLDFSVS